MIKEISMSNDSTFLAATRLKLRFPSAKGDLSIEQLWDIPLTSKNGFSVNDVAVSINREFKSLEEESFVDVFSNPRRDQLALSLEVIREVIRIRQSEARERSNAAARESLKRQIKDAIATKRQEALTSGSVEELEAKLRELEQTPA
jgi:hypothetical protein